MAVTVGHAKLRLYHLERKTVTKKVKGKRKKVTVAFWRLRTTATMKASSSGTLSVTLKPAYAGRWEAMVDYTGSAGCYASRASSACAFTLEDRRIEAAIRWATARLGSHQWDELCLRFVNTCYAEGAHTAVRSAWATARQAAAALHASAHPSTNAPRGAYVFYATPLGHVGISLGNGMMISDDGSYGVRIKPIKGGSRYRYIGWAPPPIAPRISDWDVVP